MCAGLQGTAELQPQQRASPSNGSTALYKLRGAEESTPKPAEWPGWGGLGRPPPGRAWAAPRGAYLEPAMAPVAAVAAGAGTGARGMVSGDMSKK